MYIIKIFCDFSSSTECKATYEKICNAFNIDYYGENKKVYITDSDIYTHAIIINTSMPVMNIPKQNVIGLAFEPFYFLNITPEFIEYSKKNIGKYKNKTYSVIGRVQYGYSHSSGVTTGVWDEWYLTSGSTELWITEDSGTFSIEELIMESKDIGKLSTGDSFDFQGISYLISETGNVLCMGTSGMLPFKILPNESYYYADAIRKESSNKRVSNRIEPS